MEDPHEVLYLQKTLRRFFFICGRSLGGLLSTGDPPVVYCPQKILRRLSSTEDLQEF